MNLDFGRCLWFIIPKNSQVYALCKELQNTVSDFKFSPHITVNYDMSNNEPIENEPIENEPIEKWRKIISNGISLKLDHPISFKAFSYKGLFNLELPVICSDNSGNDVIFKNTGWKPHISFGYRFHKPFTMCEKVKVYKIINSHYFTDLSINPVLAVEDCHCNSIEKWIGILV